MFCLRVLCLSFQVHGSRGQEQPDRMPEQDETPLSLAAQAFYEVSRLGRPPSFAGRGITPPQTFPGRHWQQTSAWSVSPSTTSI